MLYSPPSQNKRTSHFSRSWKCALIHPKISIGLNFQGVNKNMHMHFLFGTKGLHFTDCLTIWFIKNCRPEGPFSNTSVKWNFVTPSTHLSTVTPPLFSHNILPWLSSQWCLVPATKSYSRHCCEHHQKDEWCKRFHHVQSSLQRLELHSFRWGMPFDPWILKSEDIGESRVVTFASITDLQISEVFFTALARKRTRLIGCGGSRCLVALDNTNWSTTLMLNPLTSREHILLPRLLKWSHMASLQACILCLETLARTESFLVIIFFWLVKSFEGLGSLPICIWHLGSQSD
jgi:hypothetical protein